jgi:nucleoside-diphosphate-sugar epimerase
MKVFLTGASGFVGSHVLDGLLAAGHEVSLLLQHTSNTRFISRHLTVVSIHYGSLGDVPVLKAAMSETEAVVHCAGKIKALHSSDFYRVNKAGTRNVVTAANACRESVRHLVHISSLAVSGPGVPSRPAEETDAPRPVSVYGRSKWLAEIEVRKHCSVPWTILRPAAVYGPRDAEFLPLFQKVKRGVMPLVSGGKRHLNLVYGPDVAAAVLRCLAEDQAAGGTYHVAAEPPCTDEKFIEEIAAQLHCHPLRLHIPGFLLSLACVTQELISSVTGRPSILSRQKLPELLAPGWVCCTDRIRHDLGFTAQTTLKEGVGRTLAWYRREGWL